MTKTTFVITITMVITLTLLIGSLLTGKCKKHHDKTDTEKEDSTGTDKVGIPCGIGRFLPLANVWDMSNKITIAIAIIVIIAVITVAIAGIP